LVAAILMLAGALIAARAIRRTPGGGRPNIEATIPMACPDDLPPITNAHPSVYPHPPQEDHP
jgi:hypothetical protein